MSVRWFWSGRVTSTSFRVSIGLNTGTSVRLAVSTNSSMTSPVYGSLSTADADGYVKCDITGLTPYTQYWYRAEVDGVIDTSLTGKCKTHPTEGEPASFSFSFASCSVSSSNSYSFSGITNSGSDFFIQLGDKHYEDITTNNPAAFQAAHELCFAEPRQLEWHAAMPVHYTWSDHDYGPNNSDRTSPSRESSCQVYRQMVPHYNLEHEQAIYQSFRVGRILFVVLDERSQRDPYTIDYDGKTQLGEDQLKWLSRLCVDASEDDTIAALIIASDQQINISPVARDEHWGRFWVEREKVGNILASSNKPVVWLTGDEHRSAFRRGFVMGSSRNTVLQHGSIDSGDPLAVFGQEANRGFRIWDWGHAHHKGYGKVDITDQGQRIRVRFTVHSVNQTTGVETVPFDTTIKLETSPYVVRKGRIMAKSRRRAA